MSRWESKCCWQLKVEELDGVVLINKIDSNKIRKLKKRKYQIFWNKSKDPMDDRERKEEKGRKKKKQERRNELKVVHERYIYK